MVHLIIEKLYAKNQGPNQEDEKLKYSKPFLTETKAFWLTDAIKRYLRGLIGSKEDCWQKIKVQNQGIRKL